MTWFYLDTGPSEASWNMAFDHALHEHCAAIGGPVLRFYAWTEQAATFGYFQRYKEVENWTALRPLIRRPTGGGLVPHDRDWTYSVAIPPGDAWFALRAEESYRRVHEWVSAALEQLQLKPQLADCCQKEIHGQCFVGAEKFDVLLGGRKIAGAAQRRNKHGLLIQGSLQPPPLSRDDWQQAMLRIGRERFSIEWQQLQPAPPLLELTDALRKEKYAQAEYHQRR